MLNYTLRRFFRIAPLYYFGIAFYCLVNALENRIATDTFATDPAYSFRNIALNLLFLHGFAPSAINSVVPGGWSVGVEVTFYAMLPAILLLFSRVRPNAIAAILVVVSAVLFSVATAYAVYLATGKYIKINNFLYYNIANQLSVFLIGVMLYYFDRRGALDWASRRIGLLGFVLMSFLGVVLLQTRDAYAAFLLPVTAGLSFVFFYRFLLHDSLINNGVVRMIGRLSYSMYIFHWIFAHKLAPIVAARMPSRIPGEVTLALFFPICVALTLVVAYLSERYIEKPFILFGKRLVRYIEDSSPRTETAAIPRLGSRGDIG